MVESILEDASCKTISYLPAESVLDPSETSASMELASAKPNQPLVPTRKTRRTNAKEHQNSLSADTKQSKANSETNRSKKSRGHPQLLSQQQRILSNPLETRCTLSCLRLRDLNCLGSYLARIPNSLCFVVALDILKRPITQPHAIVMSVIGVRTGFGELFHAATQGIGVVLART